MKHYQYGALYGKIWYISWILTYLTLTFDLLMTFNEVNSVEIFSFYEYSILAVTSIYSYRIQGCHRSFMWCYLVNFTNFDPFDLDLWTLDDLIWGLYFQNLCISCIIYLRWDIRIFLHKGLSIWSIIWSKMVNFMNFDLFDLDLWP